MRGANETGVHWNVVIEWVSGRRYVTFHRVCVSKCENNSLLTIVNKKMIIE